MTTQNRNQNQDVELARQYLKAGQIDDALSRFRIVSKGDPRTAKWHSCIGSLSVASGRFAEAEEEFKQAGLFAEAVRTQVHRNALKAAFEFKAGSTLTEEDWANFLTLNENPIPGAHYFLQKTLDQIDVQSNSGPNAAKWEGRRQFLMSQPTGGFIQGCN